MNSLVAPNKVGRPRKLDEIELAQLHQVMFEYVELVEAEECFLQAIISDAMLCQITLRIGFNVNIDLIKRARRSLGVRPCGKKGGSRPDAGRPRRTRDTNDHDYISGQVLHEKAVYSLSDHRPPAGQLRGSSGADKYDKYGWHTTDYESASRRKEKQIKIRSTRAVCAGNGNLRKGKGGGRQSIESSQSYQGVKGY